MWLTVGMASGFDGGIGACDETGGEELAPLPLLLLPLTPSPPAPNDRDDMRVEWSGREGKDKRIDRMLSRIAESSVRRAATAAAAQSLSQWCELR